MTGRSSFPPSLLFSSRFHASQAITLPLPEEFEEFPHFLVKPLDKEKFFGYTLENVFQENVFQSPSSEMMCFDDAAVEDAQVKKD